MKQKTYPAAQQRLFAVLSLLFLLLLLPIFSSAQPYTTSGSATALGGDCFRLTTATNGQSGQVWSQKKLTLAADFQIEAQLYFGNKNNDGADGIAFVLQPACTGSGGAGGGIGYMGITPSLVVEYDTYQNAEYGDPNPDHMGIQRDGNPSHAGASALAAPVSIGNVENGQTQTTVITWDAETQTLTAVLNATQTITYTGDIVGTIFGGNPNVFWGFTGATGVQNNEQRVCITATSSERPGSYAVTPAGCSNPGAIDLTPGAGTQPFTYAWSNGATTQDLDNLAPGTYSVTVYEANGCVQTMQTIVVPGAPNQPPTITCPANVVLDNDPGICGATVTLPPATVNDDCPGAVVTQTGGPASGSIFGIGTATVTYRVTDAGDLSAECSFSVTVNDTEAPSITCPDDIVVGNDAGLCSAVVSFDEPVGTDNCPGATTSQVSALGSGDVFPVGQTTVSYQVLDAGGRRGNCEFTVTVNDTEAPSITCPDDIVVGNDAGLCSAVVSFEEPVGTDNCQGATTSQVSALGSGDAFPVGQTMVSYQVVDAGSLQSNCEFTVTVNDTEAPSIACPDDIVVGNDAGLCSAVVSFDEPVGTDNCPGATTSQVSTLGSGDVFPVGETTVSFRVVDAAGSRANCDFTVTVNDTEAPTAVCNEAVAVTANADGSYTVTVDDVDGGSYDNCGVASIAVDPSTIPCFHASTTATVTLTVADAAGNSTECLATVLLGNDADCDGAGDACDLCPGGNDQIDNNNDGQPDCHVFPGYNFLPESWKCGNNKVVMCHRPPDNPTNTQTVCVAVNAVASHLAHGDYLGPCGEAACAEARATGATLQPAIDFFVIPNPATTYVDVLLTTTEIAARDVVIANSLGAIVHRQALDRLPAATLRINVANLPTGAYSVIVTFADGTRRAQKLVKQ